MVTSASDELSGDATAVTTPDPVMRYADAALARAFALAEPDRADDAARTSAELDAARAGLLQEGPSAFTAVVVNAGAFGAGAELLALLVACETDPVRAARVARLDGEPRPGRLTLGAAARLLGGVHRVTEAVGPGSALRRAALADVHHDGAWSRAPISLAPGVVWALTGDRSPDPELPVGTWFLEGGVASGETHSLVVVSGEDRVRRRALGVRHCPARAFLVTRLPASETEWRAVVREATLAGAGVVVELDEELPVAGRRWIEQAGHLPWVVTSPDELALDSLPERPRRELVAADDVVDEEEWRTAFGTDVPHTHRLRADQVELVHAARDAVGGDLDVAVRRLLAGPLGRLAHRVRPRKSWDDLVLGEPKAQQLHNIVARYRHAVKVYDEWGVSTASGRGAVALFTGPSGTGKTLAAEVMAHTLDLDLYRIDLSRVVSKYIGETEQNLERLFQAASAGNAVLFFDEADSIFGKRSEVKDGRDRYANLEVSYLLQRMESYDGVVVLATNLPGNIDEAFLRRIHEIVHFTLPTAEERKAIWGRHLHDGDLPVSAIDLDRLAQRFELTGGQIRNVVLGAAFRAADDDQSVTMHHIHSALAGELLKQGRRLKTEDFDVS
jgi:AAA+ superfamily predicted ATPase